MTANLVKGVDYIGVCVVYFCHDGKGEFVMAKRSSNARDEHGRWDIGGGGGWNSVKPLIKLFVKRFRKSIVRMFWIMNFSVTGMFIEFTTESLRTG